MVSHTRTAFKVKKGWAKKVKLLPINKLVLTNHIIASYHKNQEKFPGKRALKGFAKKSQDEDGFGLNRIETVEEAFKKGISLDPIKVKIMSNGTHFDVKDGRHRFVLSLLFGYESVPVVIVE
ncbi:MAG: hypothetical protein Terrestrivirus1_106 [Terrestrivirus sp.]|uniref:ParB/Sulfiredoxin domain-containing protein n=1 Tax=Terrestrivirus sp. TaxID=2487775 RepID=A0A3G4ZK67_9VIRU|nr:MAG: hypothetical protein Terrestrivirus1_106 [Terrestrivirus sp.]